MDNEILSRIEVDLFARAMYFIASVDGVDDSEVAVIDEFLKDAGYPEMIKELDKSVFHPAEVPDVLETTDKRRLLIKVLFALIKADGVVSAGEKQRITAIADIVGLTDSLDELEASIA